MQLKHMALLCSSEKNCDRFYKTVLGLNKLNTKILPAKLSKQIFNLDQEYKIVNYADNDVHFEIFISNKKQPENKSVEHVCIEVDTLAPFLGKCREMQVDIIQVPKGDAMLTFVKDFDGNLFEIKSTAG